MATIEPAKEQLKLVEVLDTRGKGGIISSILNLPRTFSVSDGFSIEVFRREKNGERHIGSILSKTAMMSADLKHTCESMGIRNDDVLLRVHLGGKLITMTGNFTTSDQYNPGYKIVFELAVVNPRQFAIRYRGNDDPVGIALAALEGEFRLYGSLRSYDRIKTDELRYRASHTLNIGNNKETGLDIVRVHDVTILMDPYKQQELEAQRKGNLERTTVREDQKTQSIKTDFSLQQAAQKTAFAREQAALKAQYERDKLAMDRAAERKQDELNLLAKVWREGRSDLLREHIAAGYSLEELHDSHPELFGMYAELPPTTTTGYIAGQNRPVLPEETEQHSPPFSHNGPFDGVAEADTASPRGTTRQKIERIAIADLGFTLLPDEDGTFMVCTVTPGGTAALAGMRRGDVIVEVNGAVVDDVELLADTLRMRNKDQQITMKVLRWDQPMTLYINSVL